MLGKRQRYCNTNSHVNVWTELLWKRPDSPVLGSRETSRKYAISMWQDMTEQPICYGQSQESARYYYVFIEILEWLILQMCCYFLSACVSMLYPGWKNHILNPFRLFFLLSIPSLQCQRMFVVDFLEFNLSEVKDKPVYSMLSSEWVCRLVCRCSSEWFIAYTEVCVEVVTLPRAARLPIPFSVFLTCHGTDTVVTRPLSLLSALRPPNGILFVCFHSWRRCAGESSISLNRR